MKYTGELAFYLLAHHARRRHVMGTIQKLSWKSRDVEKLSESLSSQAIMEGTLAQLSIKQGGGAPHHAHINEEYTAIVSGALKYVFDDSEVVVKAGEVLVVPPNMPHWVVALEDTKVIFFFSPAREDWFGEKNRFIDGKSQTKRARSKSAAASRD
jgi:quercetin dioxygenase-like cupin family protein